MKSVLKTYMSQRLIIVNKHNKEKRNLSVIPISNSTKNFVKCIKIVFTITDQKGYPHNSFTNALNPQPTFLIRRMRSKSIFSQSIIIIRIAYRN